MKDRPGIPTLHSERMTLRPFSMDDCTPLHQIMAEPGMMQYFPNPNPPERSRVEQLIVRQLTHWEERGYGWWALELLDTKQFIGWCGLQYLPETGENEVGYLLEKTHWGLGLATEAGRISLDFGFNHLNFGKIIGIVHPGNIASQRVLEKLGLSSPTKSYYFGMNCLRFAITRQQYLASCSPPDHHL